MARIRYRSADTSNPDAPRDDLERFAMVNNYQPGGCRVPMIPWWVCSLPVGHAGDHVAANGRGILVRWAPCSRERRGYGR